MESQRAKHQQFALCLLLAALTAWIYWPAHRFDFVNYDDPVYVTQNSMVQQGLTLRGVAWAFTTNQASNWHPLTWLSLMLDVNLFGRSAGGHHAVNVLLHITNSLLLFLVFARLTRQPWPGLWAAAIFAWHPLHVESVAWISERKDVLSTMFWLLTAWAYANYVQHKLGLSPTNSTRWLYLVALVSFGLGLLSKPMLVTLPLTLLLLDVWPLRRVKLESLDRQAWFALLREKWPFFSLAGISCVVTFLVQRQSGAVATLEYIPLIQRFTNALVAYVVYLRKLFWPVDLAVFYPHPGARPWLGVVAAGFLLLLISGFALGQTRRRPWFLVGWLWYLITLIPVVGLVQVGNQAYADRYTYVPLIGVFVAVAWLLHEWAAGNHPRRRLAVAVCAAALAASAWLTQRQLQHWRNGETLLRQALAVTDRNYLAHHNLAFLLAEAGRTAEARTHYEQALAILPNYYEAHLNLGLLLLKQGALTQAAEHFESAAAINPDSAEAHYNLGVILGTQNKPEAAAAKFNRAIKLQPAHLNAHYNLGLALVSIGRSAEAETHFREAILLGGQQSSPAGARLALPHLQLGLLLKQQERFAEAREQLELAVRIAPEHLAAKIELGTVFLALGQAGSAIPQLAEVVRADPRNADARDKLGDALVAVGRTAEAVVHFKAVVQLRPKDLPAREKLSRYSAQTAPGNPAPD